jgi:uncharacterized membrane protein YhaH (DUF805 family)
MLFALFSWSGRMGRLAYLGYSLLLIAVIVGLGLLLLMPLRNAEDAKGVTVTITIVLGVMGIMGGFSLAAKRLHDLDMSAWHYVWIVFVPLILNGFGVAMQQAGTNLPGLMATLVAGLISVVMGLFLLLWPGTDGTNRFGERP